MFKLVEDTFYSVDDLEDILNEALNLGGNLLLNLANVTIPLALCNVLNGFQGAFVFILGFIGIKLFPKYFKENLNKKGYQVFFYL